MSGLTGFYQGLSGSSFTGYEIHMGTSRTIGAAASGTGGSGSDKCGREFGQVSDFSRIRLAVSGSGAEPVKADGCVCRNAAGTYVHGIFENNEFTNRFLRLIYRRKGLSFEDSRHMDIEEYKRRQYDQLADAVRENLNINEIYRMIGI